MKLSVPVLRRTNRKFQKSSICDDVLIINCFKIGHLTTVVCPVPRPLNRSEDGGDLVWLQTFLFFICKWWCLWGCYHENTTICTCRKVCNKTMSPPAALLFKGQGTEHTTVKWPTSDNTCKHYSRFQWRFFFIFDCNNNSNIWTICHNILQVAFTYLKGSYPK